MHANRRGFTLIELLIVVAIIGILAAIAIPNFMEAQVRAKVARSQADMRELKNAIYQYQVDWDTWPADSYGGTDPCGARALAGWSTFFTLQELSTPVEYISRVPFHDTFNHVSPYTPSSCPPMANHYQYWFPPLGNDNHNTGTFWNEWAVVAPGPSQDWPLGFQIYISYDPSNGSVSRGVTWVSDEGIFEITK